MDQNVITGWTQEISDVSHYSTRVKYSSPWQEVVYSQVHYDVLHNIDPDGLIVRHGSGDHLLTSLTCIYSVLSSLVFKGLWNAMKETDGLRFVFTNYICHRAVNGSKLNFTAYSLNSNNWLFLSFFSDCLQNKVLLFIAQALQCQPYATNHHLLSTDSVLGASFRDRDLHAGTPSCLAHICCCYMAQKSGFDTTFFTLFLPISSWTIHVD